MRIFRFILLLMISLIIVDFLITNDSAITVGLWPFTYQVNLSIGILGLAGILFGIIIMIIRSVLISTVGFVKKKPTVKQQNSNVES